MRSRMRSVDGVGRSLAQNPAPMSIEASGLRRSWPRMARKRSWNSWMRAFSASAACSAASARALSSASRRSVRSRVTLAKPEQRAVRVAQAR